ncbi:MAG: prolyl oligopeptidase family serine peptidase [Propionibacteriaceae bacterium]|jgi:dipeptidyl aminopeptidase/acylaminoacyl peptidase|nr:prolyl oligopeptidase family serine peptidase [Propionibacteriaceae bacterium]
MSADPFFELDAYVKYPRISGMAVSPDGERIVVAVQTPDAKTSKYVTALWEVDPAGEVAARRLTRSAKGEGAAAFTAGGDLLFVSARPSVEPGAVEETPALWLLPKDGGEARVIASRAGGIGGVIAASQADTIVAISGVLPHATDLADDERRAKARKDAAVAAIFHTSYPVRYWDHDLGPALPHYLALTKPCGEHCESENTAAAPSGLTIEPELAKFTDLTVGAGAGLVEQGGELTPDGKTLITGWNKPVRGGRRSVLVSIDVASGTRNVILETEGADLEHPIISPDGKLIAYLKETYGDEHTASDNQLWVADIDGGNARRLAPEWDRWPTPVAWCPESEGVYVLADDNGACPLWYVDLATDQVTRLTSEQCAFSNVGLSADGRWAYALRSSYLAPAEPVRIDIATAFVDGPVAATPLLSPVPTPPLPGRLEEFLAPAADGQIIRSTICLPAGASAENPAPMILWIHGGPLSSWNAWSWRWCPWLLVAQGYAVVLPDPALSTGYGLDLIQRGWGDWGGKPYTDLMSVVDAVLTRPDIDETRIGAMGGSFGGYMANWVAGHTDRFKCIVTHASLWALDQFGPTTDMASYWEREWPGGEHTDANSPHKSVANITTPMLVVHGDKDYRVPIGEGLRLWYELNAHSGLPADADGKTVHEFLYFPNENHWVLTPQHAKVWYAVVLRFLARHVLDTPESDLPALPDELG